MMKRFVLVISLLMCCSFSGTAQRFALSTNIVDYLDFGTLNLEGAVGVSRRWSLDFSAKYNPFTYHKGKVNQLQKRQQSYAFGFRYWPWHLWSGWWMAAGVKYQEYNTGGILSGKAEEGDRAGAGLSAGYSLMLHPHLNLDFGLGLWTGWSEFTAYSCPSCGFVEKSGQRIFLLPDNVIMSLVYVF